MTRDDILRWAREAGASTEGPLFVPDAFSVRLAAIVAAAERERREFELAECYRCGWDGGAAAEREACAKVCDKHWDDNGQHCANAIRARSKK